MPKHSLLDRLKSQIFVTEGGDDGTSLAEVPSTALAEKASSRAKKLDNRELREWLEIALTSCWRHVDEFYKDFDAAHLEEARLALPAISVMLEEVEKRHKTQVDAYETAGMARQARGEANRA